MLSIATHCMPDAASAQLHDSNAKATENAGEAGLDTMSER